MCKVSDAGRLRDSAAYSAAGVRKPPKEETALGDVGWSRVPELSRLARANNLQTIKRIACGDLMFDGTCTFNGLAVAKITHHTI
jgi:hypothetical protein